MRKLKVEKPKFITEEVLIENLIVAVEELHTRFWEETSDLDVAAVGFEVGEAVTIARLLKQLRGAK